MHGVRFNVFGALVLIFGGKFKIGRVFVYFRNISK